MGFDIGKAKASRPREGFIPNPKLKLLEQVREVMQAGIGYSQPVG